MIEDGNPPDNWDDLLKNAEGETNSLENMIEYCDRSGLITENTDTE